MTNIFSEIEADAEALLAKIKGTPAVKVLEDDVRQVATSTVSYIKANGLQDVYELALDLLPALIGQPWASVLAKLEADALSAGKALLSGASAIIASQAQADLLAVGKLAAPVTEPAA